MMNIKVAAISMHAQPGELLENLRKIERFTSEASAEGAKFVCFPELSASGYVLEEPGSIYSKADSDYIVDSLVLMAKNYGVVLLAGFIEITARNLPYISHVVASPSGLKGIYRKTHLSPPEEGKYGLGKSIEVYEYGGVCFGIELCYEAHFPEISTILALKNASIIFMPHASPRGTTKEKIESWVRHLRARAFDNAVFVVACNQTGKTKNGLYFPGGILVVGPDGDIIARYDTDDGETILYADLDTKLLDSIRRHRMKYFLPRRRPELYGLTSGKRSKSSLPR